MSDAVEKWADGLTDYGFIWGPVEVHFEVGEMQDLSHTSPKWGES